MATNCHFSLGPRYDARWIEWSDVFLEEAFGGPPEGGLDDLALLSALWPWSVYADRGQWVGGKRLGHDDVSTQTGKPRVELEPVDREIHAVIWRGADEWKDRYLRGELSEEDLRRYAEMDWKTFYFETNYLADEWAEVWNRNRGYCPAWIEGDLAGGSFKIRLSRVLVPDPWTPVLGQAPGAEAYEVTLDCRRIENQDVECAVESLAPAPVDWSCIAAFFQPLPYPRLHVMRLGVGSWPETLVQPQGESLDGAVIYADFDYIESRGVLRLDRFGLVPPAALPMPDVLDLCAEYGRKVCGELQDCITLEEPGVVSAPDPLPDWCPDALYDDPSEAYRHKCRFWVSIYGECLCYGGQCPPGN